MFCASTIPALISRFAQRYPKALASYFRQGGVYVTNFKSQFVRPTPTLDSELLTSLLTHSDHELREAVATGFLARMSPDQPPVGVAHEEKKNAERRLGLPG